MNKEKGLKGVLALVFIAHLALGGIGFIADASLLSTVAGKMYGASVEITPEVQHILRMLSAYMLAIGLMAVYSFINPQKSSGVIYGIIILLVLRVAQRFIFMETIQEMFGVPTANLIGQSVFYLILAGLLFYFRPREA